MRDFFQQFSEEFVEIILSGGILMVPLTFLAAGIFALALYQLFYLHAHGFYRIKRQKLANYVFNPVLAHGELRQILDYTQDAAISSSHEVRSRFAEIRNAYLAPIDSRNNVLLTLVSAAPLTGLLGTVMGMLTTFEGLALAVGGRTVDLIAGGISEALITTQTGLIIAIPGYVMVSMIRRRRNDLAGTLNTLETLTVQLVEGWQSEKATREAS